MAAVLVLIIDFFHSNLLQSERKNRLAEIEEAVALIGRGLENNAFVIRALGLVRSLLGEERNFRALQLPNSVGTPVTDLQNVDSPVLFSLQNVDLMEDMMFSLDAWDSSRDLSFL